MTRDGVVAAMADNTRVSLSLPKKLLKEFDALSDKVGQPNRSKAVSQAMREFVSSRQWDISPKGLVPGVILLTYDHHSHGVNKALTELQHEYPDIVTATMHIHLAKHTCLEIIAFRGAGDRVRSLARMLQSQKGVLDVKLVTSAV